VEALRGEFPVLERTAYLNAGTNGPVPRPALDAARRSLERQTLEGRSGAAFFERLLGRLASLRGRVAGLAGCAQGELALTGSTTDGVNAVLAALGLGRGDEVLTSDQEHPGVLAPLAGLRERAGVRVRVAPFAELAGAVGERTRLVVCSHVSWLTGAVVDSRALAAAGAPVLLDGAQGLGAVHVDVRGLGCDFYAASGQKWLCGPNGLGYLYVRSERAAELPAPWPGYASLADSSRPLESGPQPDARRFDLGLPGEHQVEWALAALDVLEAPGPGRVQARAVALAGELAGRLAAAGHEPAPRGESTLVAWRAGEPRALAARLAEDGFVVRDLPGTPYVRASVGAWNAPAELEGLVRALAEA
jgi:L-cysteine/cystine lyase